MGLDLWMQSNRCSECGDQKQTDNFSCTYNLLPMWREIYPNQKQMIDVDGLTGKESLPLLECALQMLEEKPDKFIKHNPPNGWGSYESFIAYIKTLIEAANEHPKWIWYSCR